MNDYREILTYEELYQSGFDEGFDAYLSGLDRGDNPFNRETDSVRYEAWFDGWYFGFDDSAMNPY